MPSWIARIRCKVIKSVHLTDCTESQAYANPWDYADDETEIEQVDWKVEKVEEDA